MNIEEIYQNAEITSESKNGEINRVAISYDEYQYLIEYTEQENKYKGYSNDYIEMDYHSEFIPLIKQAKGK